MGLRPRHAQNARAWWQRAQQLARVHSHIKRDELQNIIGEALGHRHSSTQPRCEPTWQSACLLQSYWPAVSCSVPAYERSLMKARCARLAQVLGYIRVFGTPVLKWRCARRVQGDAEPGGPQVQQRAPALPQGAPSAWSPECSNRRCSSTSCLALPVPFAQASSQPCCCFLAFWPHVLSASASTMCLITAYASPYEIVIAHGLKIMSLWCC